MKTRISSRVVAICLLFLAAGLGFNSCLPEPTTPDVGDAKFGSIRVMNFMECSKPFDVFIYKLNSLDTVITRSLKYSVGSAYATNLSPGAYLVKATQLNSMQEITSAVTVDVRADEAYSVMYFGKSNTVEDVKISKDQKISPAGDKVYVRFLNTKDVGGDVNLRLDNPKNNPLLTAQYRVPTEYFELNHALDTSYALYLTKTDGTVLSRLAGAAFGPGQSYTIVYAGNNNECRDTTAEKADTLRLRYFDDNSQGNDLTFPLVQSLRFNFINGLIPPPNASGTQRTYKTAGVVLNNDDRFLIPQIAPGEMARNLGPEDNGVIAGGFYTISWTDAIQVSMYANVYDGDNVVAGKRGIKLVDLRAGNRKEVKSDVPFSIIVMDTVNNKMTSGVFNVDSAKIVSWSVPLPDVPVAGKAQIVVVNALAYAPKEPAGVPSKNAKFYINGTAPKAFTTAQKSPKYDVVEVPSGAPVTIRAEIGKPTVLDTKDATFTPVDGGIYEVVLLGQNGNPNPAHQPKLLIIHTNKVSQ